MKYQIYENFLAINSFKEIKNIVLGINDSYQFALVLSPKDTIPTISALQFVHQKLQILSSTRGFHINI